MSDGESPPGSDGGSAAMIALAVTLAIQAYTALAAMAPSVLAPEIARDLGVPPKTIGVFVGLIYLGSMSAGLASGAFIERYGAIRVSQACVLFCAAGIGLVAAATALPGLAIPALLVAPVVMGLGYGPITPASSQILMRTAPPARLALTFSIKQTGVPAGAALAGAALPAAALAMGWQRAFCVVAALGLVVAVAAQRTRAALDAGRVPTRALSFAGIFAPLGRAIRVPALAELMATGFVYAALQVCLMSFLVLHLTESLGYTLVVAGFALTAANLAGIVGRIVWGAVADLYVAPRALLGLIGLAAGACAWATAAFEPSLPTALMLGVGVAFGATAIGWNGVQIAEVARNAPPGEVGTTAGAASFVTFGGVVVGPPAFALISAISGGYRLGFVVFGGLSVACGLRLLTRARP